MLKRARNTLKRAVALEGVDAETRTEGQLALVQVALLSNELDIAKQQVNRTLEEARRFELIWLLACGQRLLGNILELEGQRDQAAQSFELALRTFRKSGMHLEYARTLRLYGMMLMKQDNMSDKSYEQGLSYLQEALKVFIECKAELDQEMVERFLAKYNFTAAK
jgi:tetratricopeptide (TPR) repeat protein